MNREKKDMMLFKNEEREEELIEDCTIFSDLGLLYFANSNEEKK